MSFGTPLPGIAASNACRDSHRESPTTRSPPCSSHTESAGSGRRSRGGWSGPVSSIAEAEACDEPGDAVLEVYDTMDELTQHVPPKFAKLVADADAAREIEDLDI